MTTSRADLLVAGGGVIGLTIAWEAAQRGRSVVLVDPLPGRGAAWVAAGMLAPSSEAHFGEEALVRLLVAGAGEWPAFAERLESASSMDVGYETTGTLLLASDGSDRNDLRRTLSFQRSLGLEVEELSSEQLSLLEPALAPGLRAAALVASDHQVSNRALLAALLEACRRAGVEFKPDLVCDIAAEGPPGVVLKSGELLEAQFVVLALGSRTGQLSSSVGLGLPTVRPVKGHVLRVKGRSPLLTHTIRAVVRGRPVYLVPRRDGEIVIGASVEERGFDESVQVGEVFRLLEDARRILPGLDELELVETATGLRPGSPDNVPTIAWTTRPGVAVATGHFRNGILLAPLTARLLLALFDDQPDAAQVFLDAAHETPR